MSLPGEDADESLRDALHELQQAIACLNKMNHQGARKRAEKAAAILAELGLEQGGGK